MSPIRQKKPIELIRYFFIQQHDEENEPFYSDEEASFFKSRRKNKGGKHKKQDDRKTFLSTFESSPTKSEGRSKSLSTTVMRKRGPLEIDGGLGTDSLLDSTYIQNQEEEKEPIIIPQRIVTKMSRMLAIKKREFLNMRKTLITLQNTVLENYASMKELESRVNPGKSDDQGTDLRVLSMKDWPAHDLMLLVRDDIEVVRNLEIDSYLGSHVLQQLSTRLSPLPEEIKIVFGELAARRLDLLDMLRYKHRLDRSTYCTNLDWKTKNAAFDSETERLRKMMTETTENVKTQVHTCFQLAKIPWMDRNAILKKLDRVQKENIVLQNKLEEIAKSNKNSPKNSAPPTPPGSQVTAKHTQMEGNQSNSSLAEELVKERAACETLKEVVASAETMLRVARARIATLERQIKEMRTELDGARKKQKDIEQLYRTRETSYDARSKKLLEISKTGEMAIDTLSRQRDALELRVKELREQAAQAEQAAKAREAIQQARIDAFQAKVQEQEKNKLGANARVTELQAKVKELESLVQALREHSAALEEMDNKRCLEYLPMKEKEPTERETDLWKELQVARAMFSRAEEQLRQSRIDKDNFLNSLARIAQQGEGQGEGSQNVQAMELLEKEQQIDKLKRSVEEHEENIKSMEESMTQYENQLAGLRLEVRRLRNYDCFAKEVKYEDLETELLDLNMQIATLNRERSVLVSATAARALMLERYERATALFANMIRVRKELRALFDGRSTPPMIDDICKSEVTRSISSVCVNAADTWTALRAERVRVMRLEAALLTQRLQLERQGQVRTLLEQRRATCERIVAETTQSIVFI